jgi:two-component system nitrate/nitrite response regulator NarL
MTTRVLIVDDSALVRRLVRAFFESHAELAVIGEAADGAEGVAKAFALKPDVIVLDMAMPRMNGWEAAALLRKRMPRLPIVLFTMHDDAVSPAVLRAAGIAAVVSKAGPMDALVAEVRRAAAAGKPLSRSASP